MTYNLSYGPPLSVKDEPHRMFDTLPPLSENIDMESETVGELSTIGAYIASETIEGQEMDLKQHCT